MRMTRRTAVVLVALFVSPALADGAKPEALLKQVKGWLEPAQPSTRILTMTMRSSSGDSAQWKAAQARAAIDGVNWVLTVVLEPPDLRGAALLIREQSGKPNDEWLYLPYLRRVRRVLPVDPYESFFNTEFTYADLGFVELGDRKVTLLGDDRLGEVAATKIQEMPKRQDHFKRIVTWVAKADGRPLKREYYDLADRLWKVQTFEDAAVIHDVPTVQRMRIEDVQAGFGSEYRAGQIGYGMAIPAELFDPAKLAHAADHPIWK